MSTAATKSDLHEVREVLGGRIDKVDTRLGAVDEHLGEVDGRLRRIDTHLDKLDSKMDKLDKKVDDAFDDLTSLIRTFMVQVAVRFNRIESEQRLIKADMQRIFNFLDRVAKKQEIGDEERAVMGHRPERLDRWTHELADKIGYTLHAQ